MRYRSDYFDCYFADKQTLALFLMDYIGRDNLIKKLPENIFNLPKIKIMFCSEVKFYEFIEQYLPFEKAISVIESEFFQLSLVAYLSCLIPVKRSQVLLNELNDFSSTLFEKMSSDVQHPRPILQFLSKYCDESEIVEYLSIHRLFLLKAMLIQTSIDPFNFDNKLADAAREISFFACDELTLSLYQNAFSTNPDASFLFSILKLIPIDTRWDFLEQIFANELIIG